ncbi:MAG: tetratricopeptide repeat protein, partial [Bacteroidetes bacterium]|nr:tetratricopeptide repeat protein [Bacteroidota bacterium]
IRAVLAILITLPCPYIMAVQNWDDHDRSGRYTALDFAGNYLNSCAPDAILFTNGDNDTFPLWYAQEVEGIRTDVRVVNLSLLNTDWYIDQMARKAYGSDPLPFSLTKDKYVQGTRDYLPVHERIKGWTDIKEVMQFIASDNEETRLKYPGSGETLDYIPAKNIMVPVDSAAVISNGTVKPENASKIEPFLKWALRKNYIMKSELMVFDIMATNNWKRPVYYAITVGNDSYLGLEKYFQLEGLAYRIVPIEDKNFDRYMLGRIDADIMYDNMMNKFKWGGVDDPRVYLDENNLRMTMNFRNNFARLADALLAEGKRDSAIAVLDKCVELMPDELVPYNYFNMAIAEVYFKAGEAEKGLDIMEKLAKNTEEQLNYFLSLAPDLMELTDDELTRSMSVYNRLMEVAKSFGQDELHQQLSEKFNAYYDRFLNTINMFER